MKRPSKWVYGMLMRSLNAGRKPWKMGFYLLRIVPAALKSCASSEKLFSNARSNCTRKRARARRILPIPTRLMDEYVRQIQMRLRAKKIGYKKEFLREILKEVRVKGNAVRLTYKLPMTVRTPPSEGPNPRTGEFFTLYQMVEPMGVEPTTSRVRSCPAFPGLPIPGRNIQRF